MVQMGGVAAPIGNRGEGIWPGGVGQRTLNEGERDRNRNDCNFVNRILIQYLFY